MGDTCPLEGAATVPAVAAAFGEVSVSSSDTGLCINGYVSPTRYNEQILIL